ncbi:MAG: nucleotide exchange factor GrpE [Candidatus Eremiobacter antarcticus]|nr:nucleotide exchange factor GrpE [Candidatus Eremiobacteraeota bacterium]MBC5807820.1 nucleotide exchange factor GrpE [Candidatus Eremiobacteraeota bacterium]PZR60791.1 MAG: nucleotide exchange factor GrpE [Candidatus Eremiobacter sp. RRmetagenome_bin22]
MPESEDLDSAASAQVPGVDETPADGQASTDSEALRAELEKSKNQAEEQRQLYVRALADFDNYKRRMDRVMADRSAEGRRDVLKRLLPVLDNLERAAQYRQAGTPAEQLVDGLLATVKQFMTVLEAEGVQPIDLMGKPFDPKLGEAVGTRQVPDTPDDVVLDEARRGYMIGQDVLRPAQVIVSKSAQ